MSPESTFRPALLLMAGRAVASAFTLLIPVTLARVFEAHEYGTYRQLFLVFATLYPIALLGLSDSLYYFIPKDPAHAGRYVANALLGSGPRAARASWGSTCCASRSRGACAIRISRRCSRRSARSCC
jgi:O-antigen/teichoic acid export membrane protein